MELGQMVPEDLAAMLPGPGLAAVLAGLEHQLIPNDEIIEVLEAHSRQLAHEQARMFSVLSEVLHRRPAPTPGVVRRGSTPVPYGADEVRAVLVWSRRFADRETDLAYVLVVDLPQVWQALLEGRIDRGKAAVFAEHLGGVSAEQAQSICRRVLPRAAGWTPWQIADRIKKLILELDPQYYARRYAKAVQGRRVVAYLDADGAAVITGSGLPAEDAAAAVERVDQLARAARRAGHPCTLDQVRADVFVGLLDGSLHGLSREGIIAALLERARESAATAEETVEPPDTAAPATTDPRSGSPAPGGPVPGEPAPGEPEAGDPKPGPADPSAADPSAADPSAADPSAADPDAEGAPAAVSTASGSGSGAGRLPTVGVEIRVPLSTLLGHDQRPGELPGWGPVTPGVARTLVARQRRAEWRWVVVDPEGRWLSDGITRRRPADIPHTTPHTTARGGVVELQIPETLLTDLHDHPAKAGAWAPVIADIAAQHADRDRRARDLDAHPDARYPNAALRATSRSATGSAYSAAAAPRPAPPTRTTPSTTPAAAPPWPPIWARRVATTTCSKPKEAGNCTSPNRGCSSGPARWDAATPCGPNRSCPHRPSR